MTALTRCTPVMANDLWGGSPLYENEGLMVGRIPTVATIKQQVQDEGNCGEVTSRGEEACECVGKLPENRRQPHSRQSCEATNRNPIQGRCGQVSGPSITKPSSFIRIGKSGACAAKVIRLIQGDPLDVSVTQACLKAELSPVNGGGVGRKSAEAEVLSRRSPATTGRAEP
mgnify:FL=1